MEHLIDIRPLLVRVHADGWEPIPMNPNGWTQRERWLINEMTAKGGVDRTVEKGFYHMNVVTRNGKSLIEFTPIGN